MSKLINQVEGDLNISAILSSLEQIVDNTAEIARNIESSNKFLEEIAINSARTTEILEQLQETDEEEIVPIPPISIPPTPILTDFPSNTEAGYNGPRFKEALDAWERIAQRIIDAR